MLNQTTLTNLWNNYKNLSWWRKVLLFLPLIIVLVVVGVLVFMSGNKDDNQELVVDHNRKVVDNQIEKFEDLSKAEEKKRQENQKQRNTLEIKMKENHEELEKTIKDIDNANGNPDELLRIADELRAKHRKLQGKDS